MQPALPQRAHGIWPTRIRRSAAARILALGAALAAVVAACSGCRASASAATSPSASTAAASFLAAYVRSDGRVTRPDQGGDTVSEGQAYALLLAVSVGNRAAFLRIWTWTRTHLERPDHLFAYHWQGGAVVDANPAPDADLDIAVALFHAAAAFGDDSLRAAADSTAAAVLTYETVQAAPGRLVAAGTWAVAAPATLDPSYVVSGTASYLAEQTGDAGWQDVAAATAALDDRLAAGGMLPPDWATLPGGATAAQAVPAGAPDGSAGPRYGLDAPRLIIRLAASCSPDDRALAASWAQRLGAPGRPGEQSLSGAPLVTWRSPVTDVAVYAARTAAGWPRAAAAALASAQSLLGAYPTYYGAAWTALAPTLLADHSQNC